MIQISTPDIQPLESTSLKLVQVSQNIQIISHEEYLNAGEHLKAIRTTQRKVADLFADSKSAASNAHKAICAAEKKLLTPLKQAEDVCAQKVSVYIVAQRKAQEEEARRRRIEAEEQSKKIAEQQKKQIEDQRIALAEQYQKEGKAEAAESILNQEIFVQAPAVIPQPVQELPKVEGIHTRTTHESEVFDLMLLVQAVANGTQPIAYIMANEKALNQSAKALKNEMRIPGVRVVEKNTVVTRAEAV